MKPNDSGSVGAAAHSDVRHMPRRTSPGRRRELWLSLVALLVLAAILTLRSAIPADMVMLILMAAFVVLWAVMMDPVLRSMLGHRVPGARRPGTAAEETRKTWPSGKPGLEAAAEYGYFTGLHRHWVLGIVLPLLAAVLVPLVYPGQEIVGVSAKLPVWTLILLVCSVVSWFLGYVAWILVGALLRLFADSIVRIRRSEPRSAERESGVGSLFLALIWFTLLFACVAAPLGTEVSGSFGSPGYAGGQLRALLGLDPWAVSSPAWLLTTQLSFIAGLVVLPVLSWIVGKVMKKRRTAEDPPAQA